MEELKARFAGKQNDSAAAKPTKTEAKSTDKRNSAPSQPASVPANSETIEKLEAAVAAQVSSFLYLKLSVFCFFGSLICAYLAYMFANVEDPNSDLFF